MWICNRFRKKSNRKDEKLPVVDSQPDDAELIHFQNKTFFTKINLWYQHVVVDSSSNLYYNWIGTLTVTILFNVILLPVRAAFYIPQKDYRYMWFIFDYLIDIVNIIDLFIGSRTGFLEMGLMVTDREKMLKNYISKLSFKLDFTGILPLELFSLISPSKNIDYVWYRFNRLTKIYKLFEFIDRTDTRTNFPNIFRISSLIVFLLIMIHWNGCFFFFVSNSIGLGSDGFVYPPRSNNTEATLSVSVSQPWDQFSTMYIYSFFWSTLTLTTVAEVPGPVFNSEFIIMTLELLGGVLIFATIIGNVGSMISNMNAAKTDFQMKIDGVKRYMEFRGVGKELERRIINWFDYLWINKQSLDEDTILSTLPDKLKAEIAVQVHYETLKGVKIFQDCEETLLVQLILKLRMQVFSPGDYICRKGDIGKEMYIVKRGKLNVVADDGIKVFVTLKEGSVFGELSILNIPGSKSGNRRTANVKSVGYSDLFCLNKDDLWDVLDENPEAKSRLIERGKEILMKDNLLDLEANKNSVNNPHTIDMILKRINENMSLFENKYSELVQDFEVEQEIMKSKLDDLQNVLNGSI